MNREQLALEYARVQPLYERLARNVKPALEDFLLLCDVDFLDVECRIKEFDSLWNKQQNKKHEDPLHEMHDICGLRVIHYYASDGQLIHEMLNREFDVWNEEDKTGALRIDQFGYRSRHYVARIPNSWAQAPPFRNLEGLVFEIQVRTILMHAWAAIDHKLMYKPTDAPDDSFKRSIFRLSALVELADEQFDSLRQRALPDQNVENSEPSREQNDAKPQELVSLDRLKRFLELCYSPRESNEADTMRLERSLRLAGVTLPQLYTIDERTKPFLSEYEQAYYAVLRANRILPERIDKGRLRRANEEWTRSEAAKYAVRLALAEFESDYNKLIPDYVLALEREWRKRLSPPTEK